MNRLLLLAVGVMLLALGYMLGRAPASVSAASPGVSVSSGWDAEAGAFVSEANGTLRLWKMRDGVVVEVVEYWTAFIQEADSVSEDPAVFRRVLKPAPDGALSAGRIIKALQAPVPVPQSCGGSGTSCG